MKKKQNKTVDDLKQKNDSTLKLKCPKCDEKNFVIQQQIIRGRLILDAFCDCGHNWRAGNLPANTKINITSSKNKR